MDDKWLATLAAAVQGELDRVSQTLTGRIRQLAERYATPLPQLTDEVADARRPRGRTPQEDGGGMEVKPGYKQTEVGVIPEDWECRARLERSREVSYGTASSQAGDYVDDGDSHARGIKTYPDGRIDSTTAIASTTPAVRAHSRRTQSQAGDVAHS